MTAPDNASQPTSIGAVSTGIDGPVRTTDVIDLLEAVERIDGVAAVSEQGLLALEHDRESVRHLWLAPEGQLAGYAQVDDTGSAELCVHPAQRNRGMGRQLVEALQRTADPLTIWAHGDLPAAQALARVTGLRKTRELLQMAYELPPAAIRVPEAPVGAAVRPFRPGKDEEAWVALNSKAFVDHPEQGRMTVTDLEQRQATSWFDPSLLWLAHLPEEPQSLLACCPVRTTVRST